MVESRGWGEILSLLNTELACVCSSAGSLYPPVHAPLLCHQEQVCGTNAGLQVLFLSHGFAFLSSLTGKRKFHAFKLVLLGLPR